MATARAANVRYVTPTRDASADYISNDSAKTVVVAGPPSPERAPMQAKVLSVERVVSGSTPSTSTYTTAPAPQVLSLAAVSASSSVPPTAGTTSATDLAGRFADLAKVLTVPGTTSDTQPLTASAALSSYPVTPAKVLTMPGQDIQRRSLGQPAVASLPVAVTPASPLPLALSVTHAAPARPLAVAAPASTSSSPSGQTVSLLDSRIEELFHEADLNRDGYLDWNSGEVSSFGQAVLDSVAHDSPAEGMVRFLSQTALYNIFDDVDKNFDAKMDAREAALFARSCLLAARGKQVNARPAQPGNRPASVRQLPSQTTLSSGSPSTNQFGAPLQAAGTSYSGEIAESVGIIFDVSDAQGLGDRESRGFPHSLGPFDLEPTISISPGDLRITEPASTSPYAMMQWTLENSALRTPELQHLARTFVSSGTSLAGYLSPPHPVKYPRSTLLALQLPAGAEHCAWSYPLVGPWPDESLSSSDPDTVFLRNGGYVFFDSNLNVTSITAMQYSAGGALCFGSPRQVALSWIDPLVRAGRFRTIILHDLDEESLTPLCEHCWIAPNEISGLGPFGGFAYLFRTSPVQSTAVRATPVVTWGVDPQRLARVFQQPLPSFKQEELIVRIRELEDRNMQLSNQSTELANQNQQLIMDNERCMEELSRLSEQLGVIEKFEVRHGQMAAELEQAQDQNRVLLKLVQETEDMLHRERAAATSALEANAGLDEASRIQIEELEQENLSLRQAISSLQNSLSAEREVADQLHDAQQENARLSALAQELEELLRQSEERLQSQKSAAPVKSVDRSVPGDVERLGHENFELRERLKVLETREKRMSEELDRVIAEKDGMARRLHSAERQRPSGEATEHPQQAKFLCC